MLSRIAFPMPSTSASARGLWSLSQYSTAEEILMSGGAVERCAVPRQKRRDGPRGPLARDDAQSLDDFDPSSVRRYREFFAARRPTTPFSLRTRLDSCAQ